MIINKPQALQIEQEIRELLAKHSLWSEITYKRRPKLKEIHIKDISIKVN